MNGIPNWKTMSEAHRINRLRTILRYGKISRHHKNFLTIKQRRYYNHLLMQLLNKTHQEVPMTEQQAERRAKYDAAGVTFNRGYHPASKFKGVLDYGKIQRQFIKEDAHGVHAQGTDRDAEDVESETGREGETPDGA